MGIGPAARILSLVATASNNANRNRRKCVPIELEVASRRGGGAGRCGKLAWAGRRGEARDKDLRATKRANDERDVAIA